MTQTDSAPATSATDHAGGLRAENISIGYGGNPVCANLSVAIPTGGFTVIVGPNACGKSTLLKSFARLLKPTAGSISLDGRPLHEWPSRDFAHRVGLLPQTAIAPDGIRVADLVRRGRSPHHTLLSRWSAEDEAAVVDALDTTNTADLSGSLVHQLSGGQRQRVWIAMLLAQQTDIMLLDEPTTYLDITHQYGVLDVCERVRRESGRTVAAVLHDLNQACRYATHLIVMRDGEIVTSGAPVDVVTAELIEHTYQLPCTLLTDPESGTPLITPKTPNSGRLSSIFGQPPE